MVKHRISLVIQLYYTFFPITTLAQFKATKFITRNRIPFIIVARLLPLSQFLIIQ